MAREWLRYSTDTINASRIWAQPQCKAIRIVLKSSRNRNPQQRWTNRGYALAEISKVLGPVLTRPQKWEPKVIVIAISDGWSFFFLRVIRIGRELMPQSPTGDESESQKLMFWELIFMRATHIRWECPNGWWRRLYELSSSFFFVLTGFLSPTRLCTLVPSPLCTESL